MFYFTGYYYYTMVNVAQGEKVTFHHMKGIENALDHSNKLPISDGLTFLLIQSSFLEISV